MKHKVFRLMRTLRIFKDTLPGLYSRVSQRRRVASWLAGTIAVRSLCLSISRSFRSIPMD